MATPNARSHPDGPKPGQLQRFHAEHADASRRWLYSARLSEHASAEVSNAAAVPRLAFSTPAVQQLRQLSTAVDDAAFAVDDAALAVDDAALAIDDAASTIDAARNQDAQLTAAITTVSLLNADAVEVLV